jgi:hypothetical protein
MAIAIALLNYGLPLPGIERLPMDILAGAATFVASLLGFWILSGRPASAERDLTGLFRTAWVSFNAIRGRVSGTAR